MWRLEEYLVLRVDCWATARVRSLLPSSHVTNPKRVACFARWVTLGALELRGSIRLGPIRADMNP